jgi:hypothetical protein
MFPLESGSNRFQRRTIAQAVYDDVTSVGCEALDRCQPEALSGTGHECAPAREWSFHVEANGTAQYPR